jgi:transcriptional regulator with PAS, ATPase and Fis domain
MIEYIKIKIWSILKEKEISLAMIFNKNGEILWHRGRDIEGNNIFTGGGFSKSSIKDILQKDKLVKKENIIISNGDLPLSAKVLNVRSLLIIPVGDQFYLYLDSGSQKSFSESDVKIFKTIGEMLEQLILQIRKKTSAAGGLVGQSDNIKFIREQIIKYSILDETILIVGDTGVGKSHVAELIHQHSGREGNFVTVNTPSIPENLFESELFGYKKGAFTGAHENKNGLVTEANHGTLFLDEISEIPMSFQAKLLRFIDKKKYTILGEPSEKSADVRIIAATNQKLEELIKTNKFREDLFFRLQVLEIEILPLKKRKEDIKSLVLSLNKYLKEKTIGDGFFEALYQYDWPGNIRELVNILTKASIHCESPITGNKITEIIQKSKYKKSIKEDKINRVLTDLNSGKNFWDTVRKPYLSHDLNREEVKNILTESFIKSGEKKYVGLLDFFHLAKSDYNKFMSFLIDNDLK